MHDVCCAILMKRVFGSHGGLDPQVENLCLRDAWGWVVGGNKDGGQGMQVK